MPQVTVSVNGRNYRMACDPGQEEHLVALAARMDKAIDEFRAAFGEIGDQRLTVMASILMTDKLDETEKSLAKLTAELERLRREHDSQLERYQALEAAAVDQITALKARVDAMVAELSQETRNDKATATNT